MGETSGKGFGWLLTQKTREPMRVKSGEYYGAASGQTGEHRENPLISSIVRHDPPMRKSGGHPARIDTRHTLSGFVDLSVDASSRGGCKSFGVDGSKKKRHRQMRPIGTPGLLFEVSENQRAPANLHHLSANRVRFPMGDALRFSHVIIVPDDATGRRDFSGFSRFPQPLHSGAAPYSPRFTLIGFQDLVVKSRPNLFAHSLRHIHIPFHLLRVDFKSAHFIVNSLYPEVDRAYVRDEYTLEDNARQIDVVHVSENHLNEGRTCSRRQHNRA
ncbi:hypothetical protein PR048_009676 [Dryococelus australis]|uniref:Uncharacterized protein n=1 Tax=Dryococelus australis TaxID=614101 RepID=A0ABQ9I1J0_9NEOP|nr:hypothetical protein PR048_009676 [Dryococelus australis]